MAARKVELVARFDVPAKSAFGRRPEHEIWRDFGADRVSLHARPVRTNPRGTNAHHEFHFLRDVPRFRSEEHTSELQSRRDIVCRLLLEKKNKLPFVLLKAFLYTVADVERGVVAWYVSV